MKEKPVITTLCSHSSLQIFHGARLEGFKTLGICLKGKQGIYDAFPLAKPDEFLFVDDYKQVMDLQDDLAAKNALIIPHGSFVEYVGPQNYLKLKVKTFGNKKVLEWESDREKERKWLTEAKLEMPKELKPGEIKGPAIVKYHGAKGGRGFFICSDKKTFEKKIRPKEKYTIQELVLGNRYYPHYFFSPLDNKGYETGKGKTELLSIDRRVESNIDEIYRLGMTRTEWEATGIREGFTVTGNIPLVARESLVPKILEMGKNTILASQKLFKPGLVGPFCLETIVTPDLRFVVFEISARIVAGTNLFIPHSPYSSLTWKEPMSTGRRIAREIKNALKQNRLDEITS